MRKAKEVMIIAAVNRCEQVSVQAGCGAYQKHMRDAVFKEIRNRISADEISVTDVTNFIGGD